MKAAKNAPTNFAPSELPKTTFADLLEGREVGKFYLGDDTPVFARLARVLPEFGDKVDLTDVEVQKAIIAAFYTDMTEQGRAIQVRRVTKTAFESLKPICRKLEGKVNEQTKRFEQPLDETDLSYLRLAYALVEPEVPGEDLRAKADWLAANLTAIETNELLTISIQMDQFNLSRIREKVKN